MASRVVVEIDLALVLKWVVGFLIGVAVFQAALRWGPPFAEHVLGGGSAVVLVVYLFIKSRQTDERRSDRELPVSGDNGDHSGSGTARPT